MKTIIRSVSESIVLRVTGALWLCALIALGSLAVFSQTTNPPQILPLAGTLVPPSLTTVTTNNYTLLATDYFLEVNKAGLSITVPSSGAGAANGKEYIVKNMVAGTNTLVVTSLLDGASTYLQTNRWWTIRIRSDGSTWNIISKYEP